jgi:hypothetical protein
LRQKNCDSRVSYILTPALLRLVVSHPVGC